MMNMFSNITNFIDEIDNKIMNLAQSLVLNLSKSRKNLYNELNKILSSYSEEELLNLLDYKSQEIDTLTMELIIERFNYLKYKYEELIKDLHIELDTSDIFKSSFVIMPDAIIIINPKQIYHISKTFKISIEQTIELSILHELGHILDENTDYNIIGLSNEIFIKNAKETIFYRIEKENNAWVIGKKFLKDNRIDYKYNEDEYELLRHYAIGCYLLYYRNIVWCSLN